MSQHSRAFEKYLGQVDRWRWDEDDYRAGDSIVCDEKQKFWFTISYVYTLCMTSSTLSSRTTHQIALPHIVWWEPFPKKQKYVPDFLGRMKKTWQTPLSEAQIDAIMADNRG